MKRRNFFLGGLGGLFAFFMGKMPLRAFKKPKTRRQENGLSTKCYDVRVEIEEREGLSRGKWKYTAIIAPFGSMDAAKETCVLLRKVIYLCGGYAFPVGAKVETVMLRGASGGLSVRSTMPKEEQACLLLVVKDALSKIG